MENLNLLLKRLLDSRLDFVLIGGYAAVAHFSMEIATENNDMHETNISDAKEATYQIIVSINQLLVDMNHNLVVY